MILFLLSVRQHVQISFLGSTPNRSWRRAIRCGLRCWAGALEEGKQNFLVRKAQRIPTSGKCNRTVT